MLPQNGTPPAPPPASGAFAAQRPRTEFLPDLPIKGWDAVIYHLNRQQVLTFSLLRWCYIILWALFLIQLTVAPAGSLWMIWLIVAVGLAISLKLARNRDFLRVTGAGGSQGSGSGSRSALSSAGAAPRPLPLSQKVPVYVTGDLSVQDRLRFFACLPGFYRTFATREHALLCQARSRRFLGIGAWPEEEVGLWYLFFQPDRIIGLRIVEIQFAEHSMPGLSITYRPTQVGKRPPPESSVVHLAFVQPADRDLVLADLRVDTIPNLLSQPTAA